MILLKHSSLVFIIAFINKYILASSYDENELVFVHVISRSGARSPLYSYPSDPHKEDSWKKGWGQLTELGVFQMNEFGSYLRQRYIDGNPFKFLNYSYDKKEIHVRSSDTDRTMESANSCMDGLYTSNETAHRPIPVYVVPQSQDQILLSENCSMADKIWNEVAQTDEVESFRSSIADFLQGLRKYTSVEINSFESVAAIADNLKCVEVHNLSLPVWATGSQRKNRTLELLYLIHDFYINSKYNKGNESKLVSGALLKLLSDSMSEKINSNFTSSPRKAIFYFTHENIMASLLSSLGVFNGKSLPFASSIIVELYKVNGSTNLQNFSVQILFKNSSTNSPHVLQISGCQEKCPLHEFVELVRHNFVSNPVKECRQETYEEPLITRDYLVLVLGCVCMFFLIITMASIAFAVLSYRSTRVYRKYVDVPTEIE